MAHEQFEASDAVRAVIETSRKYWARRIDEVVADASATGTPLIAKQPAAPVMNRSRSQLATACAPIAFG